MDAETIKLLLSTQDQAYRGALEIMMKQVHEEMRSLKTTVDDLKRSLEFTQCEVDDLRKEVKRLEKEKSADKTIIDDLKKQCQTADGNFEVLEDRCDYLEDYSRRNNVHIIGLEERPGGETWEQTAEQVQKLLADKMQLPDLPLERAHRVGQRMELRARPVVARFLRYSDRELVMRNATKLRGTRIFINDDLCPASQQKRKLQLPQLKQARSEGKIAFFRHTKLVIREKEGLQGVGVRDRRRSETEASQGVPVPDGHQHPRPDGPGPKQTAAADVNPDFSDEHARSRGDQPGKNKDVGKMTLRSSK